MGFYLGEKTDPTYGAIYYYAPLVAGTAQIITVRSGSEVVFLNDDPLTGIQHTASGLGTGGFPATFTNTSGFTKAGASINGSLTWSTGTLNQRQRSQVFTVGPPGVYYFGCAFHFAGMPTSNFSSMADVIVST